MKAYLLVDFGSTYTKLTCLDMDKEKILARAKDTTTVEDGVIFGYKKALEKLKRNLPKDIEFKKILACSSAAGGLKMVAIGLGENLTAQAAKRAALGAGARILKTYSYELNQKDLEEIEKLMPDIILLSGGTDGGNKNNICYNAKQLKNLKIEVPIVVAGNKFAKEEIEEIFKDKKDYYITENVMPKVNHLNALPVRKIIRKIFMDRITRAKGMEEISKIVDGQIIPTPAAVIMGAELLSRGTEKERGLGELIVVDVGGATTDFHSISKENPKDTVRFEGLREPLAKRTVEGDLGMRYSALSLFEAVGEKNFKSSLDKDMDIYENCKMRYENIKFIPKTEDDFKFDAAIAGLAINLASKRHAGKIRKEFTGTRYIYYQRGKNLEEIKIVIGTGGVLVHSKEAGKILSKIKNDEKESLSPKNPQYYLDRDYIISAMGLLGTIEPDLAIRMMKKYLRKVKKDETNI